MRETWYVLEGGKAVRPSEVALNDKGVLTHTSGVAVEMRGEFPRSRGVDVDDDSPAGPAKATAEMQPEAKPKPQAKQPYKTRQAKKSR